MPSFSATRWWSKWEIMNKILIQFGDMESFLRQQDIGTATHTKLLAIINNPQALALLKVELSAVVDIGTYFVKATYTLEGDGVLVVSCYEEILKIRAAITSRYYPNLQAVTRELCPNPQAQQQMTIYGLSCVQPGIDYFEQTLGNDSRHPVAAFKVARLFNPVKVKEMQPKAADLDALTAFPFLSQENLHHLKEELPVYLAKVVDISQSISLLEWWKDNSADLPFWSSAASKVNPTFVSTSRASVFNYEQII